MKLTKEQQLRELLKSVRFGTMAVSHVLQGHPRELDELVKKIMKIMK